MKIPVLLVASILISIGAQANAAAHHSTNKTVVVLPATVSQIKSNITAKKGHVVVVNFWATWCSPCVAEFPSLVKLYNNYHKTGVEVITVSADQKSDINTKVLPFLKSSQASTTNYLMVVKDPEDAINAFDRTWQGDIPRTFIYNKEGKLVKILSGEQSYKEFENVIKSLLTSSQK